MSLHYNVNILNLIQHSEHCSYIIKFMGHGAISVSCYQGRIQDFLVGGSEMALVRTARFALDVRMFHPPLAHCFSGLVGGGMHPPIPPWIHP